MQTLEVIKGKGLVNEKRGKVLVAKDLNNLYQTIELENIKF